MPDDEQDDGDLLLWAVLVDDDTFDAIVASWLGETETPNR